MDVRSVGEPRDNEPRPATCRATRGVHPWRRPGRRAPAARRRHHPGAGPAAADQLRIGGEWTSTGALFAFVCWGIWAISARGNDLSGLALSFFLVLVVAAGLFTLLRLLGRVVLERSLGRPRRGARGSHLATGLFLIAAGIAYLGQTAWVVDAWTWLKGVFW